MAENDLTAAATGTESAPAPHPSDSIPVQSNTAEPVIVAKETLEPPKPDASGADAGTTETKDEAGKKKAEPVPEWMQKRFDAVAFEKREAEREARRLREELASLKATKPTTEDTAAATDRGPDPGAANAGYGSKAAFDAAVAAEANRRAEAAREQSELEKFNGDCNTAYEKGKEAFPDFDVAVKNLANAGAMSRDILDMVLATDDAPRVLYELGSDPTKAAQILGMPPAKRAMELAKIAVSPASTKAPAELSKAPPPLRPVEGTARVSAELRDDDDDPAWFAKRNKQVADKHR